MRTEQFTPGPWLVRYDEDRFDSKQSTLKIIDGSNDSLNHPQGPLVLARINVIPFAPHMDEPLANACLMASAPELLSALNRLIQSLPEDSNEYPDSAAARQVFDSIAFARAAISKRLEVHCEVRIHPRPMANDRSKRPRRRRSDLLRNESSRERGDSGV